MFRSSLHDRLFLIALGALLFLPFLGSVHLFDWDEANFAEAAREMLITGNFMRVQIDFQPFWQKPPLFFWLQAGAMSLFGINEFAARLPNALFGIITMVVVYGIGKRHYDRKFGLLWALAFPAAILPHVFYKSGIIDPVFNLFIFLGIVNLWKATSRSRADSGMRDWILSGLFIGLAVMTKGPVAFLIASLCLGVYWATTRFQWLFTFKQLAVFTGTVAAVNLLFYGVETALHGTWFIREFIAYHIELFSTSESGHGRPVWYHPVVLLFGVFPVSILAIRSFYTKTADSGEQREFRRWMLVLFWVVLTLFSIVKTKTVLYSSLTYFPLTFLGARHVYAVVTGRIAWQRRYSVALIVVGILVAIPFISFPLLMLNREWLVARIPDAFTAANLSRRAVVWSGWESLAGVSFLLLSILAVSIAGKPGSIRRGAIALLLSAIGISTVLTTFMRPIEQHTQGGAILLYKRFAQRDDVYVHSMFKSFADLFYTRLQPQDNPLAHDKEWLLTGPIDKPAYFVQRNYKAEGAQRRYGLHYVESEGGFVLLKRDAVKQADSF